MCSLQCISKFLYHVWWLRSVAYTNMDFTCKRHILLGRTVVQVFIMWNIYASKSWEIYIFLFIVCAWYIPLYTIIKHVFKVKNIHIYKFLYLYVWTDLMVFVSYFELLSQTPVCPGLRFLIQDVSLDKVIFSWQKASASKEMLKLTLVPMTSKI